MEKGKLFSRFCSFRLAMVSRSDALKLVREHVCDERLVKHMIAVGAIMRGLAEYFSEDADVWEVVGILHDIDYEYTKDRPELHGLKSAEILEGVLSDNLLETIKAHNYEHTGVEPSKRIDYALIAADAISGLIVACALVMPNKRLSEVKVKTVLKKFKSKDFARSVRRDKILFCEKLGLSLEEFVEIALGSMRDVAEELGL